LVDLLDRLAHLPAQQRDDANLALAELRKVKSDLLARHPDILRKKLDMDKRTHQAARDQKLHDCLRDASGGHVCASYAAERKAMLADGRFALPAGGATQHSTVDTDATLHRAHHALVNSGRAKCDGADYLPTNADGGTRFDEDKAVAARAAGLAKRLGRPVPRPATPSAFYWETNGTRMGLDALEREAEVERINKYRKTVDLAPL
jgi:hypothetical protein